MLKPAELAGARILVTGGAGFLGSHLLPRLLAAGAQVRGLARSPQSARRLPAGVTPVYGDCRNAEDMRNALTGCDMVIHMAAMLFGNDWQDYLAANAAAARNLGSALANQDKPPKLVLISSLAAAGPCAQAPGLDESCVPAPVSAYGWSKLLAEQILANMLTPVSGEMVILRPPIIYGSCDAALLPMFKSAARGFGVSPGLRPFPVSIIHAGDAANAIILTCKPGIKGLYHLSDGKEYDMSQICQAMGTAQNRKKTFVLHPPLPVMKFAAHAGMFANNLLKTLLTPFGLGNLKPPLWNPDKYREASQKGWLANNARIVRELGFAPQMSLPNGMAEAVAGYRQAGQL